MPVSHTKHKTAATTNNKGDPSELHTLRHARLYGGNKTQKKHCNMIKNFKTTNNVQTKITITINNKSASETHKAKTNFFFHHKKAHTACLIDANLLLYAIICLLVKLECCYNII